MAARITLSPRPPGTPARPPPSVVRTPYEQPVHLFSSTVVQSGGEAGFRAEALSNLTGKTIDVHEIRINTVATAPGAIPVYNHPGVYTEVSLSLDGKPITNGYVPIWLMGRNDGMATETNVAYGVSQTAFYSFTTLRLSQPMQMRPNARVNASVRNRGATTFDVTVDLGLVGRVVQQQRSSLRIPYITAFVGTPSDFDQPSFEVSPEASLQNKLKRTVHVDRMVGRVPLFYNNLAGNQGIWDALSGSQYMRLQRVKLAHSASRPIIRDFVPFGLAFPVAAGNSMEAPFDLAPGEYVIATLDKRPAGVAVSATYGATYKTQPQISLIGWREE